MSKFSFSELMNVISFGKKCLCRCTDVLVIHLRISQWDHLDYLNTSMALIQWQVSLEKTHREEETRKKGKVVWRQRQTLKSFIHKARKRGSKEGFSPRALGKVRRREYDLVNTLISDFWSPELWENEFLLFAATTSVVICYGSSRKWIHLCTPYGQSAKIKSVYNEIYLFIA